MEYTFLGKTGIKVSNICLGTMDFGNADRDDFGGYYKNTRQLDQKGSHDILDKYVSLGGNFIDTANIYAFGESERFIGNWLKNQNRNKIVLATKARFQMDLDNVNEVGSSRRNITQSLDASLERLQTDYVDLFQVHAWDAGTPIEETLRTLDDLVRCGKVRYTGCSNFCGWQLQKALDYSKFMGLTSFISLQQQYSLLERYSEADEFKVCKEEGIAVLPWSPLKGGLLTGKFKKGCTPGKDSRVGQTVGNPLMDAWSQYSKSDEYWKLNDALISIAKKHGKTVPQVSLRWLLQRDIVTSIIIGATSVKQLEDNVGSAKGWQLTEDEMKELDSLTSLQLHYPLNMQDFLRMGRENKNI